MAGIHNAARRVMHVLTDDRVILHPVGNLKQHHIGADSSNENIGLSRLCFRAATASFRLAA
jgi:hypothetical protein